MRHSLIKSFFLELSWKPKFFTLRLLDPEKFKLQFYISKVVSICLYIYLYIYLSIYTKVQYWGAYYSGSTWWIKEKIGRNQVQGQDFMNTNFCRISSKRTIFIGVLNFEKWTYILIYQCPGKQFLWELFYGFVCLIICVGGLPCGLARPLIRE